MRIGIKDKILDTRCAARIEGLLETSGIEAGANGIRADHGDRFAFITRRGDEAHRIASNMYLGRITHNVKTFVFLTSNQSLNPQRVKNPGFSGFLWRYWSIGSNVYPCLHCNLQP